MSSSYKCSNLHSRFSELNQQYPAAANDAMQSASIPQSEPPQQPLKEAHTPIDEKTLRELVAQELLKAEMAKLRPPDLALYQAGGVSIALFMSYSNF